MLRKDKFWIVIKENGKLEMVGEPTIFNSRKEAKDAASVIVTEGIGQYNAYVLGVEDILSCKIEAVRIEPQTRDQLRDEPANG